MIKLKTILDDDSVLLKCVWPKQLDQLKQFLRRYK
jgi:hypothetical protein